MATVLITHYIRNHVYSRFTSIFDERKLAKIKELEHIGIAEEVYRHLVPEHEERMLISLGDKYLNKSDYISVHIPHNRHPYSICLPLYPSRYLPLTAGKYGRTILHENADCYPKAIAILDEVAAIDTEKAKFMTNIIDGVLKRCTTLKQVLELWPSAIDFMPDDVRERHNAPTVKRTKRDLSDVVIDDSVKVAIITARLQGK